jgi:catalase
VLDRMVDNFFAETEQVVFHTEMWFRPSTTPMIRCCRGATSPTSIRKRLGGPNFTHLPVNAPKCPFHTLQQDGHMAFYNPKGRANYEPNSWGGETGGPRETPDRGFHTFPANDVGEKRRVRGELFADHYSQARQFYVSQRPIKQAHIKAAFVFELRKVERPNIRPCVVSLLMNVHPELATGVVGGLGLKEMPQEAKPARRVIDDQPPSPALNILQSGPGSFKGRKVGVLASDGADAGILDALERALTAQGAELEVIALNVTGITLSDRSARSARQKVNGGPSVPYDAAAIILSAEGAQTQTLRPLTTNSRGRWFGRRRETSECYGLEVLHDGGEMELITGAGSP